MKNAGSLIALLVVGIVAYMYRAQIAALFKPKVPNIPSFASSPFPIVGAPTYGYAANTNPNAGGSLWNGLGTPGKPQGPGYTLDQILALPNNDG
jgi:hypothetical protein